MFQVLKDNCFGFSLIMLLSTGQSSAKEIKTIYNVRKHVSTLKKNAFMNSLRMIVYKGNPNRFFGTTGHSNIRAFLEATLQNYKEDDQTTFISDTFKLDIETGKNLYQKDFDSKIVPFYKKSTPEYQKWYKFKEYMQTLLEKNKEIPAQNFIWERRGKNPNKVLVITAHYDTVSHDATTLKIDETSKMPGADYNASGVNICLSLIKLLYNQKLENTIRIVFLDAQALGFLGAHHYAQQLKNEAQKIIGVINLEMLGHDSNHFDKEKKYKNFKAYMRDKVNDPSGEDEKLFQNFSTINKKASVNIKFAITKNNFNNSDHFRFWDVGIPAITLTQNWEDDFNPKYQTGNDFPETLNQDSYYHAYEFIAQATLGFGLNIK